LELDLVRGAAAAASAPAVPFKASESIEVKGCIANWLGSLLFFFFLLSLVLLMNTGRSIVI